MSSPCCGGSLQTGTKIVAILQLIGSIIILTLSSLTFGTGTFLTAFAVKDSENLSLGKNISALTDLSDIDTNGISTENQDHLMGDKLIAYLGMMMMVESLAEWIGSIFSLILSIVLLMGASQRSLRKCNFWLVIQWFLMIFLIGQVMYNFVKGAADIGDGFAIMVKCYCMWIVSAFIAELQEEEEGMIHQQKAAAGGDNDEKQIKEDFYKIKV